jgi:peptidoglycan/LPS O-acetylase OafA/YrhL
MSKQNQGQQSPGVRSRSLDNLKTAIIIMSVFLHSVLAYVPWARYNSVDYTQSSSLIIDSTTSPTFSLPPLLINGFFMALMFFISGLFVWQSLEKKSVLRFLQERLHRLAIPFVLMVSIAMPLAYYPSFLLSGPDVSFFSFWRGWSWHSGPAWFLSLLLFFDLLAAIAFVVSKHSTTIVPPAFSENPTIFFLVILISSLAVLIPSLFLFSPFQWLEWGHFTFGQATRVSQYLVYFLGGVAIGARGLDLSFLRHDGPLSKSWVNWLIIAFIATMVQTVVLASLKLDILIPLTQAENWIYGVSLSSYTAIMSLASLALSLHFGDSSNLYSESLGKNSYAIYIVHYPFVTWSQYCLLGFQFPAGLKAFTVFIVSLLLSWAASELVKKIPGVRTLL